MRLLVTVLVLTLGLLVATVWLSFRPAAGSTATSGATYTLPSHTHADDQAVRAAARAGVTPAFAAAESEAPAPAAGPLAVSVSNAAPAGSPQVSTHGPMGPDLPPEAADAPASAARTAKGATEATVRWADDIRRAAAGARTAQATDAPVASDVRVAFNAAARAMQRGDWIMAIEQLQTLSMRQPDDAPTWYNLAICRGELRQLSAALQAWDRYLALRPAHADARARRAQVLLDLGEYEQAVAGYEQVRALLAPDVPPPLDVTVNQALALERLGRRTAAGRLLLDHLEREPRNVALMNRLALLAARAAEADTAAALRAEAEAWCERSLAIAPNQPEARALRASLRSADGRTTGARADE